MKPTASDARGRVTGWVAVWAGLLVCGVVGLASADESGEPASGEVDAPPPAVGLDQLLRLPESYQSDAELRGGATPADWRSRFSELHESIASARSRLVELDRKLEGMAGDSGAWQAAAPGGQSAESGPVSYKLRQDIRRTRDEIEQAERDLRALDVEADLASVPEEWRQ